MVILLCALRLSCAEMTSWPLKASIELSNEVFTGTEEITVTIEVINISGTDLPGPTTLYDPNGKIIEAFGSPTLAAGQSKSWTGTWRVTQDQLERGHITFAINQIMCDDKGQIFNCQKNYGKMLIYNETETVAEEKRPVAISCGDLGTVVLYSDGTVGTAGKWIIDNRYYDTNVPKQVAEWNNIKSVCSTRSSVFAIKEDGTVCYAETEEDHYDLSDWKDIVQIDAHHHVVGLKSDGTVVATGDNTYGQCNVREWTDIVQISCEYDRTVGLKSDGTVISTQEDYGYGYLSFEKWEDIVQIVATGANVFGLTENGQVLFSRENTSTGNFSMDNLVDVVELKGGGAGIVVRFADDTFASRYYSLFGYTDQSYKQGISIVDACDVSSWPNDIMVYDVGSSSVAAIKKDGTIVAGAFEEQYKDIIALGLTVTEKGTTAPQLPAPQRLIPAAQSGTTYAANTPIELQWTPVPYATQYKIYIKDVTGVPEEEWNNPETEAPSVFAAYPGNVLIYPSPADENKPVTLNAGEYADFLPGHTYKACVMASDGGVAYQDSEGPVFFFTIGPEKETIELLPFKAVTVGGNPYARETVWASDMEDLKANEAAQIALAEVMLENEAAIASYDTVIVFLEGYGIDQGLAAGRSSAMCVVTVRENGTRWIRFAANNCATFPDDPTGFQIDNSNETPTLKDGVYKATPHIHKADAVTTQNYPCLKVNNGYGDVVRIDAVTDSDGDSLYDLTYRTGGINMHAKGTESIYKYDNSIVHNSDGCLIVGTAGGKNSDEGSEYARLMYILGIVDDEDPVNGYANIYPKKGLNGAGINAAIIVNRIKGYVRNETFRSRMIQAYTHKNGVLQYTALGEIMGVTLDATGQVLAWNDDALKEAPLGIAAESQLSALRMIYPAQQTGNIFSDASHIQLQWSAVPNATQYKIYIKDITSVPESAWNSSNTEGKSVFADGVLEYTPSAVQNHTVTLDVGLYGMFEKGCIYKGCIIASDKEGRYLDSQGPVFVFAVGSREDAAQRFMPVLNLPWNKAERLTAYENSTITIPFYASGYTEFGPWALSGYNAVLLLNDEVHAIATIGRDDRSFTIALDTWETEKNGVGIEQNQTKESYVLIIAPRMDGSSLGAVTVYETMASSVSLTVYDAYRLEKPYDLKVEGTAQQGWGMLAPWNWGKLSVEEDITLTWKHKGNAATSYEVYLNDILLERVSGTVHACTVAKNTLDTGTEYSFRVEAKYDTYQDGLPYVVTSVTEASEKNGVFTTLGEKAAEEKNVESEETVNAANYENTYVWKNPLLEETRTYTVNVDAAASMLTYAFKWETDEASKQYQYEYPLTLSPKQMEGFMMGLKLFPVGSYFNEFRDSPCVCHKSGIGGAHGGCGTTSMGNLCSCIFVAEDGVEVSQKGDTQAVQCRGYGRYMYFKTFQEMPILESMGNCRTNIEKIKEKVIACGTGIYLQNKDHTVFVLHADNQELVVLEANHQIDQEKNTTLEALYKHYTDMRYEGAYLDTRLAKDRQVNMGRCRITIRKMTWKDYCDAYGDLNISVSYPAHKDEKKEKKKEEKQSSPASVQTRAVYDAALSYEDNLRAVMNAGEAEVQNMYLDAAGKWTIGVGHLIAQGSDRGNGYGSSELAQAKNALLQEMKAAKITDFKGTTCTYEQDGKTYTVYQITKAQMDKLYAYDVKKYTDKVDAFITGNSIDQASVTDEMRIALTVMAVNIPGVFSEGEFQQYLKDHKDWRELDVKTFLRKLVKWHHVNQTVCTSGLYNRRMDEACMFFTGTYPKSAWFTLEKPGWWERDCNWDNPEKGKDTNEWLDNPAVAPQYAEWCPRVVYDYIEANKLEVFRKN